MFDELKKKISGAIKGFVKREESERVDESKELGKGEQEDSRVKLSVGTRVKSIFVDNITLNDVDLENFIESMRTSLLQADVSYDTTEAFLEELKKSLQGAKLSSKNIENEVNNRVRESLTNILSSKGINIDEFIKDRLEKKEIPVKILFIGPNGAGKTTTVAKFANRLKGMGITSTLAAADTFRAAAIEQIEHHANKLGVHVIKSSYGADPASVAFDAIAYAKAHGIGIVLIDSAGRQETNKSLINEMQKMVRVAKPDIIIFVGESTAGNRIAEQIKEFNKFMKIDGIILTKLDCDAKGGGALSIAHTTGIPLFFLGVGESYDALMPYDPNFIINSILQNN